MTDQPNTTDQLPRAMWSGEFILFGITLHCHVLDDGTRIIDGIAKLFSGKLTDPTPSELGEMQRLLAWCRGVPALE